MGNISVPIGLINAVQGYMEVMGLRRYLDSLKIKGVSLGSLVAIMTVFGLSEDNSMAACAKWLNDIRVRRFFGITDNVSQRTLNRALQRLGRNREGIILALYKGIKKLYPDIDMDVDADGSSVAMNSEGGLSKRGYPRDKNPDGMQVEFMLGMFETARIPFYVQSFMGNVSDEEQYARAIPEMLGLMDKEDLHAYQQIADRLVSDIKLRNEERALSKASRKKGKKGRKKKPKPQTAEEQENRLALLKMNRLLGNVSWVIFDNGGASVYNTEAVNEMGHEYLTRKDMNKTDLKLTETTPCVQVEPGLVCWYETFESSGRTKYIFRADYLKDAKESAAKRKVERMAETAEALLKGEIDPMSLVEVKENEFVDFDVSVRIQQILVEYSEEEKAALVEKYKGKYCGFFHLESSAPLTPLEAIQKYRKRIAIEHAIKSLKNVAGIKPMRVWDDDSVTGRMVLALLAEAIMSMIRYEYPPDEVKVTRKGVTSKKAHRPDNKSICKILNQLTATIYNDEGKRKKVVLSGVSEESVGIFERL
jgi:transposase